MFDVSQGDILKVERQKYPVLVVSKNFFNRTEQVIACPVLQKTELSPLHIPIDADGFSGYVMCEHMTLLDLGNRGYKKISEIGLNPIMNISDAIQGIFDYYPYN